METDKKLVGVSKTMHHLLPDIVPPIDRKYILNFFYNEPLRKKSQEIQIKGNEEDIFLEVFNNYCDICKNAGLSESCLKRKWDTSIPKLIDNAIIGFVTEGLNKL